MNLGQLKELTDRLDTLIAEQKRTNEILDEVVAAIQVNAIILGEANPAAAKSAMEITKRRRAAATKKKGIAP